MPKVLYNACHGSYGFNHEFEEAWYNQDTDKPLAVDTERHDPELIALVEYFIAKGLNYNGGYADIKIEEIQGNQYIIDEHDDMETILEPSDMVWITIEEQQ